MQTLTHKKPVVIFASHSWPESQSSRLQQCDVETPIKAEEVGEILCPVGLVKAL